MKSKILLLAVAFFLQQFAFSQTILIEAESFEQKGGWVIDQQFMDNMGSPYLMAHGLGIPVENASTVISVPKAGEYNLFVRTKNWAAKWSEKGVPGKFEILLDGKSSGKIFGKESGDWIWEKYSGFELSKKEYKLELKDLTGFNGRCDAIVLTADNDFQPPKEITKLKKLRKKYLGISSSPKNAGKFDFVVIGGGMAGTCAAISAARLGVKVALVQNRPVLGGNNSSEVRVHLGGRINLEPYPALGNLVNEIGPSKRGNAEPAENYEDDKKLKAVLAEDNISLFLNFHANEVVCKNGKIKSVVAQNIETGEKLKFVAPLFADCTGDGTIGALSGAEFMTGRESKDAYREETAPELADNLTMGASVQWFSQKQDEAAAFPDIDWGLPWDEQKAEAITRGDWNWETGMGIDMINEFESIRDYGMLVVFSNWSYIKNHSKHKEKFLNEKLKWVAYVAGKRESRRLVGDYILTENDLVNHNVYHDGTAPTSWTIDLHYPDPDNLKLFPEGSFKSIAKHRKIYPYPIPFRCLYSRNVNNLFMAGRNISVSHVALGTIRLMRTGGMMGEVLGMAASVCKKRDVLPRELYNTCFEELIELMEKGTGNPDIPKIQNYNLGGTLLKTK